jgi:hypothetical protein
MNAVSAAASDAVGRELAGDAGAACLRVKCVDVLPKCLRSKDKCLGVGDGPAVSAACRNVFGACAQGVASACRAKCVRGADADAAEECLSACVFAACRRDEAVRACRAEAAVAQQTACALDRCRADFAACLAKRCSLPAAA